MEFEYTLKIPKERIAVLIGKKGQTKKFLEDNTNTSIDIDSKEGDVNFKGEDSLKMFTLREVVKAIGRGFNPELAQLLLKQDYVLEIIPLLDHLKNKNHLERVKGRIIGAEGKSRDIIEKLTDTFISVYGKTVSIIGQSQDVVIAKRAIESLITGSPHSNVYKFLEKNKVQKRKRELLDW